MKIKHEKVLKDGRIHVLIELGPTEAFPVTQLEAQNKMLLEALKVADKALRWVETTAASRAWDIVRAAIAAVEGK